jgi:uncharacterized protein (TIGR03083 family)
MAEMTKTELWELIHAQRARVLTMLETLTDEEWTKPSLCKGWSVRDVAAHNVDTHVMTPPRFFGKMAAAGFRFNTMSQRAVNNYRDEPTTRLIAEFRDTMGRTSAPPGPALTWLSEAVIHGEDMARPLGKQLNTPPDTLVKVADFARITSPLLHGKQRSAGLTLRATDVEWTAGDGPEVRGPIASIILAITGRGAAMEDLSGDGVTTLHGRAVV